jgi:hypothetical protein
VTAIGGRTMWYCQSCGGALSVGRAICSCGGKSQPEEVLLANQAAGETGLIGRVWRPVAKMLGVWDGAP